MIQQRYTHLQGVSHAGPIYLGKDIANKVGLHIQVLDAGQRVIRRAFARMERSTSTAVSLEIAIERRAEQALTHSVLHDGNAVKISFHGITCQGLRKWISRAKPLAPSQPLDRSCPARRTMACEIQGAAWLSCVLHKDASDSGDIRRDFHRRHPRQGNSDTLSRQLADPVGGHGRTIGKGLVV